MVYFSNWRLRCFTCFPETASLILKSRTLVFPADDGRQSLQQFFLICAQRMKSRLKCSECNNLHDKIFKDSFVIEYLGDIFTLRFISNLVNHIYVNAWSLHIKKKMFFSLSFTLSVVLRHLTKMDPWLFSAQADFCLHVARTPVVVSMRESQFAV